MGSIILNVTKRCKKTEAKQGSTWKN